MGKQKITRKHTKKINQTDYSEIYIFGLVLLLNYSQLITNFGVQKIQDLEVSHVGVTNMITKLFLQA